MKVSDSFSWPLTLLLTSAIEVILALALIIADSHNKFTAHFFLLSFIMCTIAGVLLGYQYIKSRRER